MSAQTALDRHKDKNSVICRLSNIDWATWCRHCRLEKFEPDLPGSVFRFSSSKIIFPTSAIFSIAGESQCNELAESSMIGNESIVGAWNILEDAPYRISFFVQTGGFGIVIPTAFLRLEFIRSSTFRRLVLDNTVSLVHYANQTCVCYRHHSPQQQIAKTLLLTARRIGGRRVSMTHQRIATILGLRREAVSLAIIDLARSHLVRQERGCTVITDFSGLKQKSCECYDRLVELLEPRLPPSTSNRV